MKAFIIGLAFATVTNNCAQRGCIHKHVSFVW